MPSALELITRAMKIAGVLGQNETPDSGQADDGLQMLNDMLDSMSTDRTSIFTITQETFSLINGQNSYTIGVGGDFNTTRPIKIDNLVVNVNSISFPVREIDAQDYANIANKALTSGIPQYFYYDQAFPLGRIYLYGAPTTGVTITTGKWAQLTQFADLTTQYTFPPGYYRMLSYNLAKEICPQYGMSLTPEAAQIATESYALIRDRNLPAPVMKTEIGLITGMYGYYPYLGF